MTDNTEIIAQFIKVMKVRREAARRVLGEAYSGRVAVYIKVVRNMMIERNITEIGAMEAILAAAAWNLDQLTIALIVSATLELIEEETQNGRKNLAGEFGLSEVGAGNDGDCLEGCNA